MAGYCISFCRGCFNKSWATVALDVCAVPCEGCFSAHHTCLVGVWLGFVRFALLLAVVLCWVDRCFDSWALSGLICPLRVTPMLAALLPAVGTCVVLSFGVMPGWCCFLRVTTHMLGQQRWADTQTSTNCMQSGLRRRWSLVETASLAAQIFVNTVAGQSAALLVPDEA